jgi:hypothetical protein
MASYVFFTYGRRALWKNESCSASTCLPRGTQALGRSEEFTMKKIQFAAAACGAAILSAGVWSQSNANEETGKTAPAAAAPATAAPSVDSEGFRASQFEGVRVREMPASTSGASKTVGGQGWIAVKPGAIGRQNAAVRSNVGDISWRKTTTADGITKLVPSSPFIHASKATRGPSGAICLQCVHAAQAKATGKSAVKSSRGARKYLGQHTHARSLVRKSTTR